MWLPVREWRRCFRLVPLCTNITCEIREESQGRFKKAPYRLLQEHIPIKRPGQLPLEVKHGNAQQDQKGSSRLQPELQQMSLQHNATTSSSTQCTPRFSSDKYQNQLFNGVQESLMIQNYENNIPVRTGIILLSCLFPQQNTQSALPVMIRQLLRD